MHPEEDFTIDVMKGGSIGSIGKIAISPKRTYLIAAVLQGDLFHTVVGWNVKDIEIGKDIGWDEDIEKVDDEDINKVGKDEEVKVKKDKKDKKDKKINSIDVELNNKTKTHICVSDDKILAYVDHDDDSFHTNDFSKYN